MSKDTVLLVIDVQKGLIEPAYRSTEVLENINALLGQAHNSHTPVIYIQHDGPKGHGLEAGTANWQIHPAIAPQEFHQRFRYSILVQKIRDPMLHLSLPRVVLRRPGN